MMFKYRINNKLINFLYVIKVFCDVLFASIFSLNFTLLKKIFFGKMKIFIVKKEFNNKDLNEKIIINRLINRYIKIYKRELLIYSLKK